MSRCLSVLLAVALLGACDTEPVEPPQPPAEDPPVVVSFEAEPNVLPFGGGEVVLSWVVEGADTVTVDGVDVSGDSLAVDVTDTTTFELVATNEVGQDSATTTVTVQPEDGGGDVDGVSSVDLIDEALAAGEIDEETALIYKTFALFGDPRLPDRFAADGIVHGTQVLTEVAFRMEDLSPEAQETLEPFLLPPSAPGSWRQLRAVADGARRQEHPVTYIRLVTEDGSATVTYEAAHPEHESIAEALLLEIEGSDGIWEKITGLMGREPKDDDGIDQGLNNGDGRFDIYLTPELGSGGDEIRGYAWTTTYSRTKFAALVEGNANATFVTVSVARIESVFPRDGVSVDEKIFSSVAHELMHAVQLAFDVSTDWGDYDWLREATATWAEDFVYPFFGTEHEDAPSFFATPELPLNTLSNTGREYGAYLYPFWLAARSGNGVVGAMWQNSESMGSLAAVDAATPGGFEEVWGEFAAANWDVELTDPYRDDGIPGGVTDPDGAGSPSVGDPVLLQNQQVVHELELDEEVAYLSARYVHVDLEAAGLHSILFANGFSFDLDRGEPTGILDETYFARELGRGEAEGREVWAIVKAGGAWMEPVDVTDVAMIPFCQDYVGERIEELVIVFANSRWEEGDRSPLASPGMGSRIFATNVACGDWAGDGSVITRISEPNQSEDTEVFIDDMVFTREQHTIEELLEGAGEARWFDGVLVPEVVANLFTGVSGSYELEQANVRWSTLRTFGSPSNRCRSEGSGDFTEDDAVVGFFDIRPPLTGPNTNPELPSLYRSYFVAAGFNTDLGAAAVTTTCDDGTTTTQPFGTALAGGFVGTELGDFRVSSDGLFIDRTWTDDDGETTFEIHLVGISE